MLYIRKETSGGIIRNLLKDILTVEKFTKQCSNILEKICTDFLDLKGRMDYKFNPKDVDRGEYFNTINARLKMKKLITPLTIILSYIFDKLFIVRAKEMQKNFRDLYSFCQTNQRQKE